MSVALVDLAVVLPLLGAIVVASMPRSEPALARALGLIAGVIELAVIAALVLGFDPAGELVQRRASTPWLPGYAIHWSLGVDGVALPMLVLIGLVVPLALMTGGPPRPGEPPLIVGMLALQATWIAVVLARDLIVFAAAWELSILIVVMLLGERGDGRMGVAGRTTAARRYALVALPGGVAMVAAVVLLGVSGAHATGGVWSWDIDALSAVTLPPATQTLGFGLVMIAVATALPLWPLHVPLVSVCVSGPTPVVAAVLGVGMPMAVFVLTHVALPMFPLAAGEWAEPLATLAIVGAIHAALVCWAEREPGRLLAHLALLHLALAIVAAVSGSVAARGGLGLYLIAHGLGLTVLTAVCHGLRRDGISDLSEVAGWASDAPRGLLLALLAGLSLIGAPGSAGFAGELALVVGVLREGAPALVRPTLWSLLGAACLGLGGLGLLRRFWRAGRGRAQPDAGGRPRELGLRETLVAAVALALALVLGVAPAGLLARTEPAQRAAVESLVRGRCLAIEAYNQRRARLSEEFGLVCLDPIARIRQFYGLPDPTLEAETEAEPGGAP